MIHKIVTPANQTLNISLDVPVNYIGKEVEIIAFIKNENAFSSPSISGECLTNEGFNQWISSAEKMKTYSMKDATKQWGKQKKKLLKLIK